jgi:hypothetical protein
MHCPYPLCARSASALGWVHGVQKRYAQFAGTLSKASNRRGAILTPYFSIYRGNTLAQFPPNPPSGKSRSSAFALALRATEGKARAS